jgi:hypothetical protein
MRSWLFIRIGAQGLQRKAFASAGALSIYCSQYSFESQSLVG